MDFEVRFSSRAEIDLDLIFDHLLDSYRSFGEPAADAFEHAAARIMQIRQAADRLAENPDRGQKRDDLGSGIRYVRIDKAAYWFAIDEGARAAQVIGVFFGGQDHVRRMLTRLLGN